MEYFMCPKLDNLQISHILTMLTKDLTLRIRSRELIKFHSSNSEPILIRHRAAPSHLNQTNKFIQIKFIIRMISEPIPLL